MPEDMVATSSSMKEDYWAETIIFGKHTRVELDSLTQRYTFVDVIHYEKKVLE